MASMEPFRREVRDWLEENCPPGARGPGEIATGSTKIKLRDPDTRLWLERMAAKGWTAPRWPRAYGGGGLSAEETRVLAEEMRRIRARAPLMGMGLSMLGPTLLELGSEHQRQRHLPRIVRGEVQWCQGYSEPGAGSDLASLRTRAERKGDRFIINGQKIWTSGAQYADWMFILVRTDPEAPKHEGISFLLMPMDQPGVTVKPIQLISGASPFCETFLDDAEASADDLVGELNRGWSVGKRLLQHERGGQGGIGAGVSGGGRAEGPAPSEIAKRYIGTTGQGRIADPAWRDAVARFDIERHALRLTQQRAAEEAREGGTPAEITSIFKLVGANVMRRRNELNSQLMGHQGVGWEGECFSEEELQVTRSWLSSRASTIYGGTNEIQRNIIAKRVLNLPELTQTG